MPGHFLVQDVTTGPDSRYYVHASTQAANAQQRYLVEQSVPATARDHGRSGSRWLDLRTDWWILIAISALVAVAFALVAFVR